MRRGRLSFASHSACSPSAARASHGTSGAAQWRHEAHGLCALSRAVSPGPCASAWWWRMCHLTRGPASFQLPLARDKIRARARHQNSTAGSQRGATRFFSEPPTRVHKCHLPCQGCWGGSVLQHDRLLRPSDPRPGGSPPPPHMCTSARRQSGSWVGVRRQEPVPARARLPSEGQGREALAPEAGPSTSWRPSRSAAQTQPGGTGFSLGSATWPVSLGFPSVTGLVLTLLTAGYQGMLD